MIQASDAIDGLRSALGVKDAFTLWTAVNQAKIDAAYAKSQNTINELNASAALGRLNNNVGAANSPINPNAPRNMADKKMLGYALIGVAGLAAVYLLLKK